MRIFRYKARVKHDHGTVVIRTAASSERAARHIICQAEGCPDHAIKRIEKQEPTRDDYQGYLNELGTPWHDMKSNGGRIPDRAEWGSWLRRNDVIAFNVGFHEWKREVFYEGN
jgi:hypothetical protein